MEIIVTQIRQFLVDATDSDSAIINVNDGRGKLVSSQDVANVRQSVKQISLDEWPIWAKAMKQFSIPHDMGIGDVIARMIGDENSSTFKAWHLATFGRPCNCTARRERWNRQFPLNQ